MKAAARPLYVQWAVWILSSSMGQFHTQLTKWIYELREKWTQTVRPQTTLGLVGIWLLFRELRLTFLTYVCEQNHWIISCSVSQYSLCCSLDQQWIYFPKHWCLEELWVSQGSIFETPASHTMVLPRLIPYLCNWYESISQHQHACTLDLKVLLWWGCAISGLIKTTQVTGGLRLSSL